MPIIKNRHPPMRKLTQPWKLCRSFGSRPVGSVVGPRWTEAGITAQQIPSLPSRRTFRGKGDSHCRPADLPTCTLASSHSSDVSITFNSKVGNSPPAFPPSHACPPRSQQLFECPLRCYRAALSSNSLPFSTLSSKKLK
jgi:hypothetical protein